MSERLRLTDGMVIGAISALMALVVIIGLTSVGIGGFTIGVLTAFTGGLTGLVVTLLIPEDEAGERDKDKVEPP